MTKLAQSAGSIAVIYLARGADKDAMAKFKAFLDSYSRWPSGIDHQLYIIFKGFVNATELNQARDIFRTIPYRALYTDDDTFDLGAYFLAASRVDQDNVFFLNTASEICGWHWLLKLFVNLDCPGVGIVGCTASYEAPQHPGLQNVPFPNPHLRSNAFMIKRDRFIAMRPHVLLHDKIDAYAFEHGADGMTRRIMSDGLKALLVGKNGRAYEPAWWVASETFRQGKQANLLVTDNQTKVYEMAPLSEKRHLFQLAWGDGIVRPLDRLPERDRTTQAAADMGQNIFLDSLVARGAACRSDKSQIIEFLK